jgi:hypothetical protein
MSDSKTTADRLARAHTSEAIGAIVNVLRSEHTKDADKLRAAELLLDRGHGKATQATITIPAKGAAAQRLAQLSTEKLLEMIEARGGMEVLHQRNAIEGEFTEAPAALPAPPPDDGSDLI